MNEFKAHSLHSGKGGPIVTNRKQAIAIGLSAQRRHGGKKPRKPSTNDAAHALSMAM